MKIRSVMVFLALAGALGGCAMQSQSLRGHQYVDGSYYAPGDGHAGDYYYAPDPRDSMVLPPGYHFAYGWPGLGYTGYCPARYRYCPSYFSFRTRYPYGFGWHDPFYSEYFFYRPLPRRRHHHPRPPGNGDARPSAPVAQWPPPPRRQESRVRAPERDPARGLAEPDAERPASSETRRSRRGIETRLD